MSHENPAANNFTENKGGRRSNELGWERLRDGGWGGVLCHMLCHMLCRGLSVSNVVLRDSASETRHFSNSAIEFKGGLGKCSLALSRWGNPTRAIPHPHAKSHPNPCPMPQPTCRCRCHSQHDTQSIPVWRSLAMSLARSLALCVSFVYALAKTLALHVGLRGAPLTAPCYLVCCCSSMLLLFRAALEDHFPQVVLASPRTCEDISMMTMMKPQNYLKRMTYAKRATFLSMKQIWSTPMGSWLSTAMGFWTCCCLSRRKDSAAPFF